MIFDFVMHCHHTNRSRKFKYQNILKFQTSQPNTRQMIFNMLTKAKTKSERHETETMIINYDDKHGGQISCITFVNNSLEIQLAKQLKDR